VLSKRGSVGASSLRSESLQGVEYFLRQTDFEDQVGGTRAHLGVRSAGVLRGQEVMADGYTESEQAARFDLHPGQASGQPASQILDAVSVGAAWSQPGFLNGIIGVANRAEHPIGHCTQIAAIVVKPLR